MLWFLLGFLPILIFVIVDLFLPEKQAIIASIVVAFFVMLAFIYLAEFDVLILIDFGLLLGLGMVAIKMENTRYFKLQPALLSFLIGLILIVYQLLGEGYMIHMLPLLQKIMMQRLGSDLVIDWEQFKIKIDHVEHALIYILFFHAALMFWLADKANRMWVLGKIALLPLMGMAFFWGFFFS